MCSLLCGKAQPVCWLMLPPAPVLVEESGKGSRRMQPGQKLGSSNAQQQQLSCWAARPAWVNTEQLLALRRAQLADPGRQGNVPPKATEASGPGPSPFARRVRGNFYPTAADESYRRLHSPVDGRTHPSI